jgi:hypothetical protein
MNVGVNYAWPYDLWAFLFDPGDGRDWEKTVPYNFGRLRRLGVSCVRVWLFAIGQGLSGNPPKLRSPSLSEEIATNWEFTPAPELGDGLVKRFVTLVDSARNSGVQLIPVLLDFGFSQSPSRRTCGNPGGGKIDLVIDEGKRTVFVNGTLKKLLDALNPSQRAAIYSFDVMNEPEWEVYIPLIRPQGTLRKFQLREFLSACLNEISVPSTVGFAFARNVSAFPGGSNPQFHYYGPVKDRSGKLIPLQCYLPKADSKMYFPDSKKPFVGEIEGAIATRGPWPSLKGDDLNQNATAVFRRLQKLQEKGYELALIWPDLSDQLPGVAQNDDLKFSIETQKAIKAFTDGMDLGSARRFFGRPFDLL